MDTELNSRYYYKIIQHDLEDRIKKLEQNKLKIGEQLKEKRNFVEKKLLERDLKKCRERITELNNLKNNLNKVYSSNGINITVGDEFRNKLQELGSLLKTEEQEKLQNLINKSLNGANNQAKEQFTNSLKQLKQLFQSAGIHNTMVLKPNSQECTHLGLNAHIVLYEIPSGITNFESLEKMENLKIAEYKNDNVFISASKQQKEFKNTSFEEQRLNHIQEMIQKGKLDSKKSKELSDNMSKIKENMFNKEHAKRIVQNIELLNLELEKIKGVDFTEVNYYLDQIFKSNMDIIKQSEQFLNKFNLEMFDTQIKKTNEEETRKQQKELGLKEYENLAYQLEKIKTEHPEDRQTIKEIIEKMEKVAAMNMLSSNLLENSKKKAISKYKEDVAREKMQAEALREMSLEEKKMKAELSTALRNQAIRNLEERGAFKERFEYRNGDAYTASVDRDELIRKEMIRLSNYPDMSSEQRGLEELKISGRIDANSTVNDLRQQQRNDFRIAYSDSTYDFIPMYKEARTIDNVEKKDNNLYKDYIVYLSLLNDKSKKISFSKFVEECRKKEIPSQVTEEEIKGRAK